MISLILIIATSESDSNDLFRVRSEHKVPENLIMLCVIICIAEALCDIR